MTGSAGSSHAASGEPMDGRLTYVLPAGLESAGPFVPKNGHALARHREVVRVACEYMMEHLEQTASAPTLSNVADVSLRTLTYAFKETLGLPPMTYYRALRFTAARRALLRPGSPACTVTSVATRFGFFHLGRFSVEYRSHFHESPSATLERSGSVLTLSRALGEPRATRSPGTPIRSAS